MSASNQEMYETHMNGAKHKAKMKRVPRPPGVEDGPKVMMDGTIMLGTKPINFPMRGGGRGGPRGGRGGGRGGKMLLHNRFITISGIQSENRVT